MYNNIIKCGLVDIFREINKNHRKFSWFSYFNNSFIKNNGLRVDMFFSNTNLFNLCLNSNIDYFIRSMNKPSDHAPIWSEFNI